MSKEKSRVDVIITTYNRCKVLETTLKSVLAQTYKYLEIIVVDDGSTDETPIMVMKYADRVKYIRQQNMGVEAARKKGVKEASGIYINFLDDDDLMTEDKIEKQVYVLDTKPEVGIVHCGYYYIDEKGDYLDRTGWLPQGDVRLSLAWGCFPWSGGPLIRKECFNLIDENEDKVWYTDWGMWLRFSFAGGYKWECIQKPLGYYRQVRGSMIDDKVSVAEDVVFYLLKYVYSNYQLTEDIIAEKNLLYAGWHIWISCRYYAGGFWNDGIRNLLEATKWNNNLLKEPNKLLDLLFADTITPRVRIHDPILHIENIFKHLPESLISLQKYKDDLLARIYANLIMKSYASRNVVDAEKFINGLFSLKSINDRASNIIYAEIENYKVDPSAQVPFDSIRMIVKKFVPTDQMRIKQSNIIRYLAEANINCAYMNYIERNWHLLIVRIWKGVTNYPFVHFKTFLYLLKRKIVLKYFKK
jgi:glycosyltransferase involved in cell wall biosynthesis